MSKNSMVKSRVERFVEENFSDFSKCRRRGFVQDLEGRFAGYRYQAMWVIIRRPNNGSGGFDLTDIYAADKEDAKEKLNEFRQGPGKGFRCVVQKMLRVESETEVVHLT